MEAEITYLLEEQARKLENAELLIERLKREVMALSFSVELHDRAAEKARALWAEAHPDDAEEWLRREDLMVWLMDRVERAEAVKESLTSALKEICVHTAHWKTVENGMGRAFAWVWQTASTALRTAEESSVVGLIDSTPAKQPKYSENAEGDWDSVIDDNHLQVELDREKRKNEDLYRDFKGANDLYLAENMRAEKLRMALWEIRHIIWKNARMRWYSVGFWKLLVPIFSIAHNALQPSEKSSEIMMDKKPGAEVTE